MFFGDKDEKENFNKIAALLIHAARIDQDFSAEEERIIEKTLSQIGVKKENIKEDVVKITKEDKIQIIKEIQLNQYEVQHGHLFKTFMNTLGINIPYDECKELIKESFNIFSIYVNFAYF